MCHKAISDHAPSPAEDLRGTHALQLRPPDALVALYRHVGRSSAEASIWPHDRALSPRQRQLLLLACATAAIAIVWRRTTRRTARRSGADLGDGSRCRQGTG